MEVQALGGVDARRVHAMVRLRVDVFVVEQDVRIPIWTAKTCVLGTWAEEESVAKGAAAVACARILAPGVSYAEPSIGRVATRRDQRGKGIGKEPA